MKVQEISLHEANAFVIQYHRHHDAARGHKWSLGAYKNGELCGVCIVGRPVGRRLDDGHTLEITRLCSDGTRNACSCLYGAAARRARKEGYSRIITFILESEPGTSLKAAGWELEAAKCGKPSWDGPRYRERHQHEQLTLFPRKTPPKEYKQRWGKALGRKEGRNEDRPD